MTRCRFETRHSSLPGGREVMESETSLEHPCQGRVGIVKSAVSVDRSSGSLDTPGPQCYHHWNRLLF